LAILAGCSSTRHLEEFSSVPKLIKQESLPAMPASISSSSLNVEIQMQIDEDGGVNQAHLRNGSGDTAWDSLAVQTIKKWKYDQAPTGDKPVKTWIVQHTVVTPADPFFLSFAEIVCDTHEKAINILDQLKQGTTFGLLAVDYSSAPSKNHGGGVGNVDVNSYQGSISSILKKLEIGQYTEPLVYGNKFVIFKRSVN